MRQVTLRSLDKPNKHLLCTLCTSCSWDGICLIVSLAPSALIEAWSAYISKPLAPPGFRTQMRVSLPFANTHEKEHEFYEREALFSGIQKWSSRKLSNRAGSST